MCLNSSTLKHTTFFFKKKILFISREGGRKKGKETSVCGCLLCAPYWGPGPQPRHVPWLVIEPVIFWFTGQHSIHWATPAGAKHTIFVLPLVDKHKHLYTMFI